MSIDWAGLLQDELGDFTVPTFPPEVVLPALPLAVTQFVQKSSDPGAQIQDLVHFLEVDWGLTIELLRQVNSASVGSRNRVGSAMRAMSVLGLPATRNLVIAVGTRTGSQARQSRLVNQACFWKAALQKALFAREVAALLETDQDVAYTGALLQDYLLPELTSELYGEYLRFIQTREQTQINIWEFEQTNFGWDHALAGACLAQRWKFPDDLVCCILFHHQGLKILSHPELGHSPVAAVALAALLPDQLRQSYHGLEQLVLLEQTWPRFNLLKIVQTVDAKQAEAGLGMLNEFPLTRRCQSVASQHVNHADAR